LTDLTGRSVSFPDGRHALLCFVKEDCPTCGLSMPLIEAAFRTFGPSVNVLAIGQERAGNQLLADRHRLTVPILDDSALKISFAYGIEIVPTVILADPDGIAVKQFIGFGRQDWQDLFSQLSRIAGIPAPDVDWSSYPESRPGCGSRSLDPAIVEGLQAEAEGSPLRARRIEIGEQD